MRFLLLALLFLTSSAAMAAPMQIHYQIQGTISQIGWNTSDGQPLSTLNLDDTVVVNYYINLDQTDRYPDGHPSLRWPDERWAQYGDMTGNISVGTYLSTFNGDDIPQWQNLHLEDCVTAENCTNYNDADVMEFELMSSTYNAAESSTDTAGNYISKNRTYLQLLTTALNGDALLDTLDLSADDLIHPGSQAMSFELAGADGLKQAAFNAAITDINVSVVPVPAAIWLFGSALAGLGWMKRKQAV
jgi:hypothetical protein